MASFEVNEEYVAVDGDLSLVLQLDISMGLA